MPMSNYPFGFPYGVTLQGVPINIPNSGQTYWLYNGSATASQGIGGSDGNPGTFQKPFATLAFAISKCVAGRGDVIYVKPGHAETISSATALTLNISQVSVVGLGVGLGRPMFTLDTANTSTINVSADDISFVNCNVTANFLSVAAAFTLSTARGFTLQNCLFRDSSGVLNFLNYVKTTGAANTADGLTCVNNQATSLGTTSVNTFILSANDINRLTVIGTVVKYATTVDAAGLIVITAGILTNLDCGYNKMYRANTTTANGSLINVGGTTSTGFVYNNYVQTLTTSSDKIFVTTVGLAAFNNYSTGVVGASGFLVPTADS